MSKTSQRLQSAYLDGKRLGLTLTFRIPSRWKTESLTRKQFRLGFYHGKKLAELRKSNPEDESLKEKKMGFRR